ncbi:MAG: ABC transporter ATP-binding protein [Gemmatimonadetes bacterium]|nr:ABC transporter ATP-binding protein [Gemmatimonadota bacterium]
MFRERARRDVEAALVEARASELDAVTQELAMRAAELDAAIEGLTAALPAAERAAAAAQAALDAVAARGAAGLVRHADVEIARTMTRKASLREHTLRRQIEGNAAHEVGARTDKTWVRSEPHGGRLSVARPRRPSGHATPGFIERALAPGPLTTPAATCTAMPMPPVLELSGMALRLGGRDVLAGVSFSVEAGEIVVVIGPNGAGKTLLLELVVGARPLQAGQVLGRGVPLTGLATRAGLLAWVADEARPTAEMRVVQLLAEAARIGGAPAQLRELIIAQLALGPHLRARAGVLSRGERHRVAIAEALLLRRPLTVLDEPLAAFDPLQRAAACELLRGLAREGHALLMTVHEMHAAEHIADRIILLHEGRVLAQGPLAALRASAGRETGDLEDIFVALLNRSRDAA